MKVDQKVDDYLASLVLLIQEHINTLIRKKSILVRTGDYGETVNDSWLKELDRFLSIVDSDSEWKDFWVVSTPVITFIDEIVASEEELINSEEDTKKLVNVDELSGEEFEAHCASILEANGWAINRTPWSGDQGVDLIAENGGHRIAIQCKRYSSPVGNQAIQQVYTGMSYYDADEAIVVSNNRYTQSAEELANKLGVSLLHYSDLSSLSSKNQGNETRDYICNVIEGAERGNAEDQSLLGGIYSTGYGDTKVNYVKAVEWFKKSAAQGYAQAQYSLGLMYLNGGGVRQNSAKAVELFEKAAMQGYAEAQYGLGLMYFDGDGVRQNSAQACELIKKSAAQGNSNAQNHLGLMYAKGEGVNQNFAQAKEWYEKSAAQGNAEAQYNLGLMLYQASLGDPQKFIQAFKWFEKSAAQGYAGAQFNLGVMYAQGEGVSQDFAQAISLWEQAAAQKHNSAVTAQFYLGVIYHDGRGVSQDFAQAKEWYKKACDNGNQQACEFYLKLEEDGH